MARLMDMGLEKLKNLVMDMASLSEESVTRAMELYVEGKKPSGDVFDQSEKLRILQEEVSELSVELIARYQPVASDLRFIKSCMEIAYGFSRFGRYAYDITEVLAVVGDISTCDKSDVIEAGKQTQEMIRLSIKAFTKTDTETAREVKKMDDTVDQIYRDYVKKATTSQDAKVKCSLSGTLILRYLERIADHATYIAESTLYIASGERRPRL